MTKRWNYMEAAPKVLEAMGWESDADGFWENGLYRIRLEYIDEGFVLDHVIPWVTKDGIVTAAWDRYGFGVMVRRGTCEGHAGFPETSDFIAAVIMAAAEALGD